MTKSLNSPRFDSAATVAARDAALARISDLMEAMAAAYALMAHADGEVAGAERRRIFAIFRAHPAMSVFSRDEISEEIAAHEAGFRLDPELAQQIAREKLAAIAGQGRAVHTVLTVCRDLIPADGIAHPAEYRILAEIKALLRHDDQAHFRVSDHAREGIAR